MKIEVTYLDNKKISFNCTKSYQEANRSEEIFSQIKEIALPTCLLTQDEPYIFSLISNDGKVSSFDIGYFNAGSVQINDWACSDEGKGLTIPVLKDLQRLSGHVSAQTIQSGDSLRYWLHMCKKGLVQELDDVCASTGDHKLDSEADKYLRKV